MTTLCDHQIHAYAAAGLVTPYLPELVNPASLDVRLGDALLIESAQAAQLVPYPLHQHSQAEPYWLRPGQFVLGHTLEVVSVPESMCAQFMLKSSRGREGFQHMLAGYVDPGFRGSLTLELHNSRQLHAIAMWPGMRIGQLVLHPLGSTPLRSYAETGRYQGDLTVQESRG
jgi:dCTP deaminase